MIDFNKNFFEEYQNKLLSVANSVFLRWILGLNRLPKELKKIKVETITPNSLHYVDGDKLKAVFFTRPRFSEALAYNLTPFVYLQNIRNEQMVWRFSPVGVLSLLLLFIPKLSFVGFFGTTTSYYSGAGDGVCSQDYTAHSTWANSRDAADSDSVNYTSASGLFDTSYALGVGYSNARLFFPIDTSGLTSGATISAATFYHYDTAVVDETQLHGYYLIQTSQASTSELVVSDFNNVTYTAGATMATVTGITLNQYNSFSLNATGLSWISKTGYTKLGIVTEHDFTNTAPSVGNKSLRLTMYFSEQTGTANDPYLSVTYTTLSTSSITKSSKYCVRNAISAITKSSQYKIKSTPSAITKSLSYDIKATPAAITKSVKYCVTISPNAITKSFSYDVAVLSALTKNLQYVVQSTPSAVTKSNKYGVVITPSALTKGLQYSVSSIISAITKTLVYTVKSVPVGLTKGLSYLVYTQDSIIKDLQYKVSSTPSALIKSVQYCVKATQSITKNLDYIVITPITLQKALKYDISDTNSITKSLRYSVVHILTKSLTYSVVHNPYSKSGSGYSKVDNYTKAGGYTPL